MNVEKFLNKNEKVEYEAKASFVPVIFFGVLTVVLIALGLIFINVVAQTPTAPAIVIGVVFLALAFFSLVTMLQYLNICASAGIAVTDKRVLMYYGIFKSVFSEIPIEKISGVTIREPFLGKVCGYGDVTIESSAATSGVRVKCISKPFEIKKHLSEN